MLEQVSQAHVDSDGAYKWAKQCQLRPVNDEEIDNPSKFYANLDAKWSAALNLVVKGTVASNISLAQQRADAAGRRITGRRKAVIIWEYFQTLAAHGGLYSFQNLMAVQLHGHNLVDFQAKWLTVCNGLKEPVAEAIRRDLLYKQIKDELPLKFDVDQYLRAEAAGRTTYDPEVPSFTLQFLELALDAAIVRDCEAKRAKEMDRSVQTPGEAAGATAPGAKSKAAKAAAKKAAAEASAADKAAEANKHKQSMARQVPAELGLSALTGDDCKERGLCFAFQKGKCTKGKACPWKHIMAKTRERSASSERGRANKREGSRGRKSRSGSREQRDTSEVPCKFSLKASALAATSAFTSTVTSQGGSRPRWRQGFLSAPLPPPWRRQR